MVEWHALVDGIVEFMTLFNFILIILGLILGVVLGAIPGLTGSLGIALMLPVTFTMDPLPALVFLIAIYTGGLFGGAITAVLINTPGSPAAVATTLDGYPMTKQGFSGRALGLAVGSSAIGGLIGAVILLLIIQPLATVALKFGPTEMFIVAVFGLTIISSIQEGGFIKSIFAGLFGVLIGTIGMTDTGAMRGTFGSVYLLDGIPMIPALIGLFAISELFFLAEKQFVAKQTKKQKYSTQLIQGVKEVFIYPFNILRSSIIGVFVGALPAAGSTIASLLSYNEAKRFSKSKNKFGKGSEEGIIAAETANNSSEGGALATMLVLGIPGSASTAMLLGAIIMQGWVPGPRLFVDQSAVIYGAIFSMIIGLALLIIVGGVVSLGAGRIINIPTRILIPIIVVFALVGAFSTRNMLLDAFLVFLFGVIGWYLRRNKYPVIAVVLGLILGPIADGELLKSVQLHGADTLTAFFTRPLSLILIIITLFGVLVPVILGQLKIKECEILEQFKVPCVVYRGGTSRGLFFHEKDLPSNENLREHIFLKGIGAQDSSHINGLGAGTSHTSKVVIINESTQRDIDIDYTFVQLGIGSNKIDYEGTCGNLMAATGAFAVDEGIVTPDSNKNSTIVSVWNTNISKKIDIHVPLYKGEVKVSGEYKMTGVSGLGAPFTVDIKNPGGGKTGEIFPIGLISSDQNNNELEYTFSDIVNPFTYLRAKDLGIEGTELNSDIMARKTLLNIFEKVRINSSVKSGLAPNIETAENKYVALPKVAYVSEPKNYKTSEGKLIPKDSYDILARMVSINNMHKTFAVSGLLNLASTCLLENTIPNKMCDFKKNTVEQTIRIGHPEGVASIKVKKKTNDESIEYVQLQRTVRRIMKGELYIPILT